MFNKKPTRSIRLGNVLIGGGAPVSVQSMTNTDTRNVQATVDQIRRLEEAGCDIVRVAVPDQEAAQALKKIKEQISIPLVADIHFDYRLAMTALANGVDALRLNPGNIGSHDKVREIVKAAAAGQQPIRIGVNAGSLKQEILLKYGGVTAQALVESALEHVKILEELDFFDIKISLKAFELPLLFDAYKLMSETVDYPLHIGVTEAGTPFAGTIRSAVGIGTLLSQGIGDTLRVSLTGDPVTEVKVGIEILKSLALRQKGPVFVSCPTCGRTQINLIKIAEQVEQEVSKMNIQQPLKIAIMGCVVNGPGEAREADIGVAGGDGVAMIFKKGQVIRKVSETELVVELLKEIKEMLKESGRV